MRIIIIIVLFIGIPIFAHAEDQKANWFCTEESGKRDGNVLWACGVGEAPSESLARNDGLREAINEFKTICQASIDCNVNQVTVEPKRMTCLKAEGHWKCYRLIEVVMQHKDLKKGELAAH